MAFIDRVIKHDEKGDPFSLTAYQRPRAGTSAQAQHPSGRKIS
jgi:hypothetical protein